MIRAILVICILAAGCKALAAVHDMTQRAEAARVAILKGDQ